MLRKLKKKRILVVDDEIILRKMIALKLHTEGFEVLEAENGEEGLKLTQKKTPDLVLTDIQMPIMDGFELLSQINRLMLAVPVIVITGQSQVDDVIRAVRFGVRDFIRKPFEGYEMMQIVKKALATPLMTISEDDLVPLIEKEEINITIPNDQHIINLTSSYVTRNLASRGLCTQIEKENIRQSVREALMNAMIHGNMELSSKLKTIGSIADTAFNAILQERILDPKYQSRKIILRYCLDKEKVFYEISDQGVGFDVSKIPDPLHADNIFKPYGRGIFFIKLHMDEVSWFNWGKTIRILKYRTINN